ncbi:MAG TPA: cupredoxin domain-containing protein [Solirubrobacteraceae bacterium]|jgi:plastocyanin
MDRRPLALLAVSAISVAALGGQVAASAAATKTVTLKDIAFSPERLSVARGTTVTFRWRDGTTTHNVTSTGAKRFKTIPDRTTGTARRKFTKAGVYRYACTLHPGMTGQITVR